jgi:hypothetical protein
MGLAGILTIYYATPRYPAHLVGGANTLGSGLIRRVNSVVSVGLGAALAPRGLMGWVP